MTAPNNMTKGTTLKNVPHELFDQQPTARTEFASNLKRSVRSLCSSWWLRSVLLFTLKDGTHTLSRNVGKQLPTSAA